MVQEYKIGTLVRQKVPHRKTYRYGLVAPSKEKQLLLPYHINILWTPTDDHPVSNKLYYECVSQDHLEILSAPN